MWKIIEHSTTFSTCMIDCITVFVVWGNFVSVSMSIKMIS